MRRTGQLLRAVVLAAVCGAASAQLTPIMESVSDVTMKACPTAACQAVNVQITVGHQDPAFALQTLTITWSPNPPLSDAFSPLSSITAVLADGAQRVIALSPNGKIFGSSTITVTVRDTNPTCTVAAQCTATQSFNVIVEPLSPVFDNTGPTRSLVDFKTLVATPTYPYTFLVGHEDDAKLNDLNLIGTSTTPDILPNNCCGDTATYRTAGGINLVLHPYNAAEGLSFVVGEFVVKARRVTITIRPSANTPGDATLTFRLADGPTGTGIANIASVTVEVLGRPTIESFCAYDVLAEDSLQSVADKFGMHWMTLYLFNNHTLPHPDTLTPGIRIATGRPYIVKPGDSLYSIASKYGTTWQHIKALNPAIILDEKSLFQGQLLCVAPDLAFLSCRNKA